MSRQDKTTLRQKTYKMMLMMNKIRKSNKKKINWSEKVKFLNGWHIQNSVVIIFVIVMWFRIPLRLTVCWINTCAVAICLMEWYIRFICVYTFTSFHSIPSSRLAHLPFQTWICLHSAHFDSKWTFSRFKFYNFNYKNYYWNLIWHSVFPPF